MKVAVVGAGIVGTSSARQLASRGHQVVLFEQFPFGHSMGSSHGTSRIVRRAYPDAFYTECMLEGYPMWAELQAASGIDLLHEVGLVYFGSRDSAEIQSVAQSLESLNVDHQVLDSNAVKGVFPQLHLGPLEVGVWTPEAGYVNAELALKATWVLARNAGVEMRPETGVNRQQLEETFDAFVVCPGAWITKWANVPVKVTLETFAYLHGNMDGPVWIEDEAENPYGFPSEGRESFKIGIHHAGGVVTDPDSPDRAPSSKALKQISETATKRFGIENPQVEEAVGCLYTSTWNEDFLLGHLGAKGFFASSCSGHGFKFGPWIGKLLADFVDGSDAPVNHPRFYYPEVNSK